MSDGKYLFHLVPTYGESIKFYLLFASDAEATEHGKEIVAQPDCERVAVWSGDKLIYAARQRLEIPTATYGQAAVLLVKRYGDRRPNYGSIS